MASRFARSVSKMGCGDPLPAVDFVPVLTHNHLVTVDIAAMARGVEARSPLLDHEAVESTLRHPEALDLRGSGTGPRLCLANQKYVHGGIGAAAGQRTTLRPRGGFVADLPIRLKL